MGLFKLFAAFAFAAIVMGRFPQENALAAGLRAQLAAAHPEARLVKQFAAGFTPLRQMFQSGTIPAPQSAIRRGSQI